MNCNCTEPFHSCPSCRIDLSKPGEKKKKKPKAKRILIHIIEKPEKLHCRRCNQTTGGEAFRHLETFRKHEFGKGTGQKCNDKLTAWLCTLCDIEMSNNRPHSAEHVRVWQHAEEWLYLVIKTWLV